MCFGRLRDTSASTYLAAEEPARGKLTQYPIKSRVSVGAASCLVSLGEARVTVGWWNVQMAMLKNVSLVAAAT